MSDKVCPMDFHKEYDSPSVKLFHSFLRFKKLRVSRVFNKTSKPCSATLMLMYRMTIIQKDNEGIKVKDLSELMHVSVPSMSRTIKNLEEQGLLIRKEDKTDRRNTYVILSEEGKKISENYVKHMKSIGERVCERMGQEKIDKLIEYLIEMHGYLEEEINIEAKEIEKEENKKETL